MPLAPSGVKLLSARGRFHLKMLSKETGTDLDVVPSASVVRVRARHPDTAASVVAEAKGALLRLVGSHQAEIVMDLAAVGTDASPWSPPPPPASLPSAGGRGGGVKRRAAPRGAMQAVMGSDESDDENCGGGGVCGGGGGAAIARKPAGASNRSVSNESVRRTARLHGCEAEFVAAPPSANGRGGGGGESGANGGRNSGAVSRAGADKQRQNSQHSASRRQDAGRGGGGVQPATVGAVTAPRNTQSRRVSIRGPPGLVENARNALVALVLGREESEVSLRARAAAALGEGSWRKIQVRCTRRRGVTGGRAAHGPTVAWWWKVVFVGGVGPCPARGAIVDGHVLFLVGREMKIKTLDTVRHACV